MPSFRFINMTILTVVLALSLLLLAPLAAWCIEEESEPANVGQGLTIVSAVPADGAGGIDLKSRVKLTFNQDLADGVNNSFFSWQDSQGYGLPFKFHLINKRTVELIPQEPMEYAATYMITVKAGLTGADGSITLEDQTLAFVTKEEKVDPPPKKADIKVNPQQTAAQIIVSKGKQPAVDKKSVSGEAAAPVIENTDPGNELADSENEITTPEDEILPEEEPEEDFPWLLFILVIMGAVLIGLIIIYFLQYRN
ncbi:MAG: Ig-like domain-containing protein [Clostridiales bacterium]